MTNPLPCAIAIGGRFVAFDLKLSGPVAQIGRMLGDSAAPVVSGLAERYGVDHGRVTRIIMASTVPAFASFSALGWVF